MSKTPPPEGPKLTPAQLAELKKKLLSNLSDPQLAERVDEAEAKQEEAVREGANKVGRGGDKR